MTVYADNAATTKMSPAAIETMTWAMENVYGNPSSLHTVGQKANEALQNARATCARLLNCDPKEIYFTSGGSEADNQAIRLGGADGREKRQKTHHFHSV